MQSDDNSTSAEPVSDSGQTKERGLRILRITAPLFAQMFMAGDHPAYRVTSDALPSDVSIRNCRLGWPDGAMSPAYPDVIELLLESAEFSPPEEGKPIPLLLPHIVRA